MRHRLTVVTRRTRFRLGKRRERAHLVDGLLIAILDIDEVIAVIRSSDDAATARSRLMQIFDLTEPQASYILELQLRRLTKFSVIELEKERDELAREIEALEAILADDVLLRRVVSRELAAVAEQFGTPRRTVLLEASGEPVTSSAGSAATPDDASTASGGGEKRTGASAQPMTLMPSASPVPLTVPDDPCRVVLSATGLVARIPGAEPVARTGRRQPHDALTSQVSTTARGRIGAVTDTGRLVLLDVVSTTEVPRTEGAPGWPARLRFASWWTSSRRRRWWVWFRWDRPTTRRSSWPRRMVSSSGSSPETSLGTPRAGRSSPCPRATGWSSRAPRRTRTS